MVAQTIQVPADLCDEINGLLRAGGFVVVSCECESREQAHTIVSLWLDTGAVTERRSGSVLIDCV